MLFLVNFFFIFYFFMIVMSLLLVLVELLLHIDYVCDMFGLFNKQNK